MKKKMKVVNCSSLACHTGAGTSYTSVRWLKAGVTGTVIDSKDVGGTPWYKWSQGDWCSGKYLKLVEDLEGTPKSPTKDKEKTKTKDKETSKGLLNDKGDDTGKSTDGKNADNEKPFVRENKENKESTSKNNPEIDVLAALAINQVLEAAKYSSSETYTDGMSSSDTEDYTLKYDFIQEDIANIKDSFNIIYDDSTLRKNMHTMFNRFKVPYPEDMLSKSFAYVFFTRPNCNFFKDGNLRQDLSDIPEYYYMNKTDPNVFKALTSKFDSNHKFHPFLSNMATSFELSDLTLDTMEHGETSTGHKIMYAGTNVKSKTAGSFNVNFVDNKSLQIYRTVYLWEKYCSDVKRGVVTPTKNNIRQKILDYASSAYFFLVGPDGANILFWSKYYGVFPTSCPSSALSWNKGDLLATPNYPIPFVYSFKEDFDPMILSEFNTLGAVDSFEYREIYDEELLSTGRTWVGAPFVETLTTTSGAIYNRLRFRTS